MQMYYMKFRIIWGYFNVVIQCDDYGARTCYDFFFDYADFNWLFWKLDGSNNVRCAGYGVCAIK